MRDKGLERAHGLTNHSPDILTTGLNPKHKWFFLE